MAISSILQTGSGIEPEVWGFIPDTINHEMMPKFGRGLESYEKQLMMNRSELEGKVILDLGSGPELKFATDLKIVGVSAHVISMSPDFGISMQYGLSMWHLLKRWREFSKKEALQKWAQLLTLHAKNHT